MADLYSDIPELSAEQAGILRRKKIAELIQAQSMKPIEESQPVGRYRVPVSPLQGIGKVLEAYLGKKASEEADTAQGELGKKYAGLEDSAVADYIKSRQPQPAILQPSPEMGGGPGRPEMTPSQSDMDLANVTAQTSDFPKLRVAGALQARLDEQEQARKETIAARTEAAKIAAAAKLQSERERRDMMLLLANNKQEAAADKAQAKLDADLEKKANAAKLANKSFDDLIFKIDQLVDKDGNPLPGFTSAFGQIDALYPNMMKFDKTSKAYKNLESIQAQETMRGLADAKEQVGQSFGSMQVKEWDRFTNLVRSLDPSQPDKASLLPNLINLRNEAIKEKEALQSQIGSNQPIVPTAPSVAPKEEVWVRDKNGKLVKQ